MASNNSGYRSNMNYSLEAVTNWAGELERREAIRGGKKSARRSVARKAGVPPGLLENLSRKRLKFWRPVMDGIRAAFIAELQNEIARMSHDLQMARQCGAHPGSNEVNEAQELLSRAKELLEKAGT